MTFYRGGSNGIQRHFDGEWLDYGVTGTALDVRLGIRPKKVAILTLLNLDDAAGTVLYDAQHRSIVIHSLPGQVLCFDNISLEHGATPIERRDGDSGVRRCILSWRSLDDECFIVRNNISVEASIEEVVKWRKTVRPTVAY